MKLQIPLSSKEYVLFMLSAIGFFTHLVDEMTHGYDLPPTIVLILSTIGWVIYPFCSMKVRGVLGIIASLGVLAGLGNAHLIPFVLNGFSEGIMTAIIGSILALVTGIQGVLILLKRRV